MLGPAITLYLSQNDTHPETASLPGLGAVREEIIILTGGAQARYLDVLNTDLPQGISICRP
jgi:hypothetical protein